MARLIIEQETHQQWYVYDTQKDFHTQFGVVSKEYLQQEKPVKVAAKGTYLWVIPTTLHDDIEHLKRKAQVILPKDAGYILSMTGANKSTVVVDAGAGSGWLSCFLALYVKKVHCCDINEHHLAVAQNNAKRLGVTNITFYHHDIYTGLPATPTVLTLDVPEPWRVFEHTAKMQIGSSIVCYSPSITQSQQTVLEARLQGHVVVGTYELQVRDWHIKERIVRPKKDEIGPTGFLTFIRVMRND